MSSFSHLGLSQPLLEALDALAYETPSDIQEQAIPAILEGKDIIGISATGSGKTAAFTLPALDKIDPSLPKPQVLILSPTRELCSQVGEEAKILGKFIPAIKPVSIYGGAAIDKQITALKKGAQLVIGTPGRLLDHLRRKTLNLSEVSLCILDEADRMLDMGFREEMEEILSQLRKDHQILFFSATMNRNVENLIKRYSTNPIEISVNAKNTTVTRIEQSFLVLKQSSKLEALSRVVDYQEPKLAVVFCNTKLTVDECAEKLALRGYSADKLHGDITQVMRERVISRFKKGGIKLLIATDVAGRGLDIEDVELVVNYDLPRDAEDYVHRIGRTGRAGRSGKAVSLVTPRETHKVKHIERYIGNKIQEATLPNAADLQQKHLNKLISKVEKTLDDKTPTLYNDALAPLLAKEHTAETISSALIQLLIETTAKPREIIFEDNPKNKELLKSERASRRNSKRHDENDSPRESRNRNRQRKEPLLKGQTQLFLGIGSIVGCRAGDFLGMLCSETSLEKSEIGKILLFPRHTLVQVPEDKASKTIKQLKGVTIRGKSFMARLDRDI